MMKPSSGQTRHFRADEDRGLARLSLENVPDSTSECCVRAVVMLADRQGYSRLSIAFSMEQCTLHCSSSEFGRSTDA